MKKKISYKTAGVDITKANDFVSSIKGHVASTMSSAVLNRKGSFGALFGLDVKQYKNPVLVSSTDGVGTKLLIANAVGKHDTVGIDLVAMNVNDILCVGAKPLFFLDYIACGQIDTKILNDVVKGIAVGCKQSGCALIGGETAEMPGMYKKDDYDLAGFAVGVVEKSKIIDGSSIKCGDKVIGLPSSGLHSNGYSLVRKALSALQQKKYAKEILEPTRIYAKEVLAILEKFDKAADRSLKNIKAIAHITGGAFYEKLTRVLPEGKCFSINKGSWDVPKIFDIVRESGNIDEKEMYRTFNMGIGLAIVVDKRIVVELEEFLKKKRIKYFCIGEVINDNKRKIVFNA
ncbi:MAG: phosphoribosylformylglycinamidine cyclo-ligase [Omnitrophica WOR_2 bacterium GWF2_38_59]|nr:MAG: phosphoribosylformylglycinamidine cyclo-ligase [Omnitrophica WOR_2 bacterium GWF2_38_59]OGX48558.1 MAG: phosphoribosylformylglycinamidine cyclo-ligase [Omnitrophica WOR_2 bacterium RIFOXYA2_FULL_38_17]OGX52779.1 MAG: phosphoribosylformylglycinamidine cyclo-ligase [Omnitrophica WOR_2 bacterium RIFOXYA12_FULL_38_10]OGX59330.1 MAG: phosphoribosylformylglycinamidine cyclo-ligase [Omnitrophica WOR_2 bacterium RIFOXYB2_FULL_38_16]